MNEFFLLDEVAVCVENVSGTESVDALSAPSLHPAGLCVENQARSGHRLGPILPRQRNEGKSAAATAPLRASSGRGMTTTALVERDSAATVGLAQPQRGAQLLERASVVESDLDSLGERHGLFRCRPKVTAERPIELGPLPEVNALPMRGGALPRLRTGNPLS